MLPYHSREESEFSEDIEGIIVRLPEICDDVETRLAFRLSPQS